MRRVVEVLTVLTAAAITLVAWAGPVGADPPKPTNYESRVLRIVPATTAVQARVVGGDGFLELTVARGHTVIVPSTSPPSVPYLRFLPDGTVEENQLSPTTYLNKSRSGTTPIPADALAATASTPPVWKKVASNGQYAWHDHRIHWMGGSRPPSLHGGTGKVDSGGPNGDWIAPIVVDGKPAVIQGELILHPGTSPLPSLLVGVPVAVLAYLIGRRRPVAFALGAVAVGGLAATFIGAQELSSAPSSTGVSPLLVILPVLALVAVVTGRILRPPAVRVIAALAGAAILLGWVVNRIAVLWNTMLPTSLAPWVDRLGTAAVGGLALAAAVLAVESGELRAKPLPDEVGPLAPSST